MGTQLHTILLILFLPFIVSCKSNKIDNVKQKETNSIDSSIYRSLDPLLVLELPEAETYYLKQYPNRTHRNNDTLFIFLRNGKTKTYINSDINTDRERFYRFHGIIYDLPYMLITVDGYEDFSIYLLHDSLGSEYYLESKPYFSSDKNHFVISFNNVYDEPFNITKVWRIDNNTMVLEYENKTSNCSSTGVEWLTDNTFRYYLRSNSSTKEDTLELTNIDGKWHPK